MDETGEWVEPAPDEFCGAWWGMAAFLGVVAGGVAVACAVHWVLHQL